MPCRKTLQNALCLAVIGRDMLSAAALENRTRANVEGENQGRQFRPLLGDSTQSHANRRNNFLFPCDEVGVVCLDLGQSVHAESLLFKGGEGFDQAAEGA